jgi:hypothetical protein
MKTNYRETELSPIGFLARDSLSGVAELVKGLITRDHVTEEKLKESLRTKFLSLKSYN